MRSIESEKRKKSERMNQMSVIGQNGGRALSQGGQVEDFRILSFLERLSEELNEGFELVSPNPYLYMTMHLIKSHFEGKIVTPTSLLGASRAPYATATRKLKEMQSQGLIEQRARTKTAKSFSLHPSKKLLQQWTQTADRIERLGLQTFGGVLEGRETRDYYFGGSYMQARDIAPLQVLPNPIKLSGGLRVLVHGDPTFMVMDNLKRQFEQVIGAPIKQRAFSIDRLYDEAKLNARHKLSHYDIIAVDLPWIGEFAEKGILMPLDEHLDQARLDPLDFHTNGWKAAQWNSKTYGVPAQTTPELLFYRKDLLAYEGLEPPRTTDELLHAARRFHQPEKGRYGIAWNAARGTALGHTVLMTFADFGQPIINLPKMAGGYDTDALAQDGFRATIDTERGLAAAEFLMELIKYSPNDILSMSWYERVRPYAEGRVAMAYGYTLLAPYFELNPESPAYEQTGYLPHPAGEGASRIAHVGGYVLGIPANLAKERIAGAIEGLQVFTSPEAQKLYIQSGSRTNPRYSVASDHEVRRISPIFEAVDEMAWRDELQFWPRPPIPEIGGIIQICGEVFHDMLRGLISPQDALSLAQSRADLLMQSP